MPSATRRSRSLTGPSRFGNWTTVDGLPLTPNVDALDVQRYGRLIARVSFAADSVDPTVVESVCAVAVAELDNALLRAELAAQLVEVNESRARIAAAQTMERRTRRNLHDGAQKRLLALAMNQQAALLNGTTIGCAAPWWTVSMSSSDRGELREIANGLHPTVLADGGLGSALDDLARRSTISVDVRSTDARFDAELEACAWFVACEAVTNAQKHADAAHILITAHVEVHGSISRSTTTRGAPTARLRAARVARSRPRARRDAGRNRARGPGTRVHARLPCES